MKQLAGMKFGKLIAIKRVGTRSGFAAWACTCDCGNGAIVTSHNLLNGNSKTCGCSTKKHGRTNDYIFRLWGRIKDRCYNPKVPAFKFYGANGIKLFKPWHDASTFIKDVISEIGERPIHCHSLDRKNGRLGYEPGNIRWATWKEQANNRKNNRLLTHNDKTMNVTQWAKFLGLTSSMIITRMKRGWTVHETLTTPRILNHWAHKRLSTEALKISSVI